MKKLHTSAFLAATAALAVTPIISAANVSAAPAVTYKGFNALNRNTLNGEYSYSKIYYTDDTVITNVKVGTSNASSLNKKTTTSSTDPLSSGRIAPGETYTALIENSTATDPSGNPLDVLYKISDVHYWTNEVDDEGVPVASASIKFAKVISGSRANTHPTADEVGVATNHAGDPVISWITTTRSDAIFTVEFCEKGTYSASTDSCTKATSIKNISTAMWDFDVPNMKRNKDSNGNDIIKSDGWYDYSEDGNRYFHGNEGIAPTSGNTTIYMNTSKTFAGVEMSKEQNGFSVKDITGGTNFAGIWYGNSIMATATDLDGSWSYRYSGRGCGVGFIFGSAVPYVMPKPVKAVDKTKAKVGETVTYRIRQEVPENYSSPADIVAFTSLWNNFDEIPENKGYSTFKITDSFDENLTLPASSGIKIANEKGDVTSQFTITVNGQNIEAVAKHTNTFDFYGHTYTITVPTTVKSNVAISPVRNLANTVYTPEGGTNITLTSDPVETAIYHTVVTRYIDDDTGEPIADPASQDYAHGDHYTTTESDDIPEKYTLVKTPDNAEGTADKDYEVIYRYRAPRTVTVYHVDDETGKPIADPTSEEYPQGNPYETNPLKKAPNGYQLVKTPENAKGTVGKEDIEVIYRYRKVKNPNTADGSVVAIAGAVAASVLGGGIVLINKRRR